jgi:DNA-directed RNA polymerase beta subunit
LVKKEVEPFCGWQVEGTGRFLLGDMSVVHNTPEGAPVGLVKNMAMSTHVTNNTSSVLIRDLLEEMGVQLYGDAITDTIAFLKRMGSIDSGGVTINGDIVGFHEQPFKFYRELKRLKISGAIPPKTGIVWDIPKNMISISTEAGRLCRPIYIVDDTKEGRKLRITDMTPIDGKFDFHDLLHGGSDHDAGCIEFMDVDEVDKAMIAMFPSNLERGIKGTSLPPLYTHCEIHPSLMLGVLAANIPFMDHNQSPRNCYQCLWIEEPVLMVSGQTKPIKDIKNGDDVLTFHPTTGVVSNTKVIAHIIRPASKPMCAITTISGRRIYVTTDHKFMTDAGWQDSTAFTKVTKIGVYHGPSRSCDVSSKSLITARLAGYYKARPSLGFDSLDDEDRYSSDCKQIGFAQGYRDAAFLKFISEYIMPTEEELLNEYTSGTMGGAPLFELDIAQTMTVWYAYNRKRQMITAMQAEYQRYLQFTSDTVPMSRDGWDAIVEVRKDVMMIPMHDKKRMPSMMVADITVESENHSFIGGQGFAVSNSAMGKQAVGIYASNFNNRTDTMAHVLHYPMRPLVSTQLSKYVNAGSLPSGITAIVAIATYTGFNQEDSVIMNQSSLDRGMFSSTYYKSYRDQCSKNHSTGEEEVFMKPALDGCAVTSTGSKAKPKPFNYDKLDADGFVPKDTYVDSNDILVGKVMPHKVHGALQYRDTSMQIKGNDDGYVDMNYTGTNGDGYKFCKVRLRKYRKPMIGDKMASRHAQKGTIGMVYKEADMPFTKDGIRPDIIMNPHAVPSRMTIAQLMECIMSKTASGMGACCDGTPFNDCSVAGIAAQLGKLGYEKYGNEILYNGRTGQQIQTEIFIGPVYYQRLKHMTVDKVHSRSSNGPIVLLTRQPAEGRARNGGLRFGEMERDGIVAHGAGLFLKERMLDVSDNFRVFPCRKCGLISTANPDKNIYKCGSCRSSADIVQIRMPFCFKLLLQELESMSVGLRFCF